MSPIHESAAEVVILDALREVIVCDRLTTSTQ